MELLTLFLTVTVTRTLGYEDSVAMESRQSGQSFRMSAEDAFSVFLSRTGEALSEGKMFGNRIEKGAFSPSPSAPSLSNRTASRSRTDLSPAQLVTSLLTSGSESRDVLQEELKELLFGEEEGNVTRAEALVADGVIEGDRAEFSEYSPEEYDLYSYDTSVEPTYSRRNDQAELPVESRQRRPIRRRRPYRDQSPRRQGLPPIRPELHKVPGRIQGLGMVPPPPTLHRGQGGRDRVPVPGSTDCDFYTEELCLGVRNYPRQEIVQLLGERKRRHEEDMIAEVSEQSADDLIDGVSSNQEATYTFSHYFGDSNSNRREDMDTGPSTRDFAQEGGFLCPSEIKYAKPKRGKTAQGTWKDIVNVNDYTQTLRMEKCLKPGGSCSYVSHHYKSQCSQVYNYHRLLSWDRERGLHMDIYKVPTCCSCHIMGYSYVYPPLKKTEDRHEESISSSSPHSSSPHSSSPHSSSPHSSSSRPPRPHAGGRPPQSFVDFGSPPSPHRPPAHSGGASEIENFIPDFNPQLELESFMDTIGGDDFKDFGSFGGKTGRGRATNKRQGPLVSRPSSSYASDPRLSLPRRRGDSVRRGDGFGPGGKPGVDRGRRLERSKYEAIPLDNSELMKKQLAIRQDESEPQSSVTQTGDSINYGYHPIIDFFQPYRYSSR